MKRHHIDAVLMSVLVLLAVGSMLHSASGGERAAVEFLALISLAVALAASYLLIAHRCYTRRAVLPVVVVPLVCLSIIISTTETHWPLRVTYALSRDAFDEVAQRVRAGEHIATPVRVGLFTVRRVELNHLGIVCLWTHPHPSGSTGFVQCPRDDVPFNLWSIVRLDDRWQFISED